MVFERNGDNLKKYEAYIGMAELKNLQRELYRETNGKRGRYWLALSPRWTSDENTKYAISYWVNYGDNNTYGNFTVEQILEWFNNPKIKLHEVGGIKDR